MANLTDSGLFLEVANEVAQRGLRVLVETGTGPVSSGCDVAKRLGLHAHSCDVYEPCVTRAAQLYPEFDVYYGDSEKMLREILPRITAPTFFWLDGHCPTDPSCLPGTIFPAYEELRLIRDLKPGYERDVIWVDDVSMITAEDNPVRAAWDVRLNVPALGDENWHGAGEHTWAEYLAVFADTHDARVDEAVLKLTPKGGLR